MKTLSLLILFFFVSYAACQSFTELQSSLEYAENNPVRLVVNCGAESNFSTVQGAIDAVPAGNKQRYNIHVCSGIYREKVIIPNNGLKTNPRSVILVWNESHPVPTSQAPSFQIFGRFFIAKYISFLNDGAPNAVPGAQMQAPALMVNGDYAQFYNCFFHGWQDTLYDKQGKHYFKDCVIEGNIDFIFGAGQSIYQNCKIISNGQPVGVLTANSRQNTSLTTAGYVFNECYIGGTGTVSLGRPWGAYALTFFVHSYLESIVKPEGWEKFVPDETDDTCWFAEYENIGPGANVSQRVWFGRQLTKEQADYYTSFDYINGTWWIDQQSSLISTNEDYISLNNATSVQSPPPVQSPPVVHSPPGTPIQSPPPVQSPPVVHSPPGTPIQSPPPVESPHMPPATPIQSPPGTSVQSPPPPSPVQGPPPASVQNPLGPPEDNGPGDDYGDDGGDDYGDDGGDGGDI